MKNHTLNLARLCLLVLSIIITPQLFGQKTITGIVTDGSLKEALIGGTVQVKGKTLATVTDLDGKYSIVASPKDILVFTYIGMEKQEVNVENQSIINITLQSLSTQLGEVVAIGYGTVKKSDLTGSVAVVSSKDLSKNPASSAAQALQGKAPGVLVTQSGKPGGGASIRVRGVGSINLTSEPIYILDGVRVSNIDGIQTQDIENLQVLKDASASAIYGADGSNGVVIINTKRGKSGKIQANLNTYLSITLPPNKIDVMNADQYSAFYNDVYANYKKTAVPAEYQPAFREKYYGTGWQQGTDWQNQMFRNGMNQNYNLSLAGGSDNSNFSLALNYLNETGNVIKTSSERYGIRANSDFKINKHIKVGENFSANYQIGEDLLMNQATIWDLNTSPLMKVYNSYYKGGFESPQTAYWQDTNGNLIAGTPPTGYTGKIFSNTSGNDKPNLLVGTNGSNKNYSTGLNASVYLQIDFNDWLSYKITPSAEIINSRGKSWWPSFTGNRSSNNATLSESYSEGVNLNFENQLSFKKRFNEIHNVQATLVSEFRQELYNNIGGVETGFNFESLNTLSNGGTTSKSLNGVFNDYRRISYLGRVMYDYKGIYFATASYRVDGVTRFAPDHKWGSFASGSLACKINELFLKDVNQIDALKLRIGFGQTGNSAIQGYFPYLNTIDNSNNFAPVFGSDQHITAAQYAMYGMANPILHWETAEMYNFGTDLSMFNGKLQASAEYYIKNNNDLIVAKPASLVFGLVNGNPWTNIGKIQNQGIELSFQWRDKIGKFNYGIVSNFTTIKNKVISLQNVPYVSNSTSTNRSIVSQPIASLYGYVSNGIIQLNEDNYAKNSDGTWQQDASGNYTGYKHAKYLTNIPQPGDLMYKDLDGNGVIDSKDKTVIGKTIPDFNYTLGFDCSYENFDFNIFLYGVNGNNIYNQQRASLSTMNSQDMDHNKLVDFALNHWTIDNPSTTNVRIGIGNTNSNDQLSSFWVEDGSFLRIKDIQIGYNLPAPITKQIGISSLRIYANVSNLYCFTSYKGRDPELLPNANDPLTSGIDNGNYTVPRSFTFGLQIGF